MVNKNISKAFAKISTAIVLVVMIIMSCISAVAVNQDVVEVGVKSETESVSASEANIDFDVPSNFYTKSGANYTITGVDATYYDYLSDEELYNGSWLSPKDSSGNAYEPGTGYNGSADHWYPFYQLNNKLSGFATEHGSWTYPLYFGNFCSTGRAYMGSNHGGPYTHAIDGLKRWNYAVNNSNGLGGYHNAIRGLVNDTLDNNNVKVGNNNLPLFDKDWLKTTKVNNHAVAKTIKSYFPFRTTSETSKKNKKTYSMYHFDSINATDNVYFAWRDDTSSPSPKEVRYGSGPDYGIKDGLSKFMNNTASGYGIFPFNNASNHWNNNPGNNKLDYGFGIKLDIDFRVPENGLIDEDEPVKFNYSGDDDLWVYLSDDEGHSKLVLDLGGNHKMTSGSLDFSTMKATSSSTSDMVKGSDKKSKMIFLYDKNSESGGKYVKNQSNSWDNVYMYAWNDSGDHAWFQAGFDENTNRYYFCKDQVGMHSDGSLSSVKLSDMTKGDLYDSMDYNSARQNKGNFSLGSTLSWGKCYNIENGNSVNTGNAYDVPGIDSVTLPYFTSKEEPFGLDAANSTLDPDKIYHMTVFYMERGTIESNFKVDFTMMPLVNSVTADKTVKVPELNAGINTDNVKNTLKSLDTFSFKTTESGNNEITSSKNYVYTNSKGEQSNKTMNNKGSFELKDSESAYFENQFAINNNIKVEETVKDTKKLDYTTNWKLYDLKNSTKTPIKTGSNTTSEFTNINAKNDENQVTALNLKYENEIKTAPVKFKKIVKDEAGEEVTDDDGEFEVTVKLDTNFDNNFSSSEVYPVKYNVVNAGSIQERTATNTGKISGIKVGQEIQILNLPVGMKYQIVESANSGSGYEIQNGTITGTVSETASVGEIVNKKIAVSSNIQISKTLDDVPYTGEKFRFTATALKKISNDYVLYPNDFTQSITVVNNGLVKFNDVTLDETGDYYYVVTEEMAQDDTDYQVNNSIVVAKITYDPTVAVNNPDYAFYTDEESESYIKDDGSYNYTALVNDFDGHKTANPVIENVTTKLKLNVTKSEGLTESNQAGVAEVVNPIAGAEFEIYPVQDSTVTDFAGIAPIGFGISNADGVVMFYTDKDHTNELTDLPIFNGTNGEYQVYAVRESKAADGYALTDDIMYVSLDSNPDDNIVDPVYHNDSNMYEASFGFINTVITVPITGIQVQYSTFYIGCLVLGFGAVVGTFFFLMNRRKKVTYISRHGR